MFNTIPNNPFPPSSANAVGGGGSYVLPVASADTLGGVKVGNNLSIANGVLSAPAPYTPPAYSTTETNTGQKWIDGKDIYCRVFDFGSDVAISSSTWVDMSEYTSIEGWDKPVQCAFGIDTTGLCITVNLAINAGYLEIRTGFNTQIRYLTVYYTKTESEG